MIIFHFLPVVVFFTAHFVQFPRDAFVSSQICIVLDYPITVISPSHLPDLSSFQKYTPLSSINGRLF